MKIARYWLFLAPLALLMASCRTTSHTIEEQRKDSVISHVTHTIADTTYEHKTIMLYDSIVVVQYDTLGRVVSVSTAIHHGKEQAESGVQHAEVVQSASVAVSAQERTENTQITPASAPLKWWQRFKAGIAAIILFMSVCACVVIYYGLKRYKVIK